MHASQNRQPDQTRREPPAPADPPADPRTGLLAWVESLDPSRPARAWLLKMLRADEAAGADTGTRHTTAAGAVQRSSCGRVVDASGQPKELAVSVSPHPVPPERRR
jgi:hypothetical protein